MSKIARSTNSSHEIQDPEPTSRRERYVFSAAFEPESDKLEVAFLRYALSAQTSHHVWVVAPTNCNGEYCFCLDDSVALYLMNTGPEVKDLRADVCFTNADGDRNPYLPGGTQTRFHLRPGTPGAVKSDWRRGQDPTQAWFLRGNFTEEDNEEFLEPRLQQNGTYQKKLTVVFTYKEEERTLCHDPRWVVGTGHPDVV
ncbi:MAG: hypothetical protein AAGC60_03530 [Acidobacteriota bacterium]